MLDSIDAWILQQKTLILKKTRGVLPAVRDRQSLASTLRGLLGDLGLKRRSHNEPSLSEYLVGRAQGGTAKLPEAWWREPSISRNGPRRALPILTKARWGGGMLTILDAMHDPKLFGPWFKKRNTWRA